LYNVDGIAIDIVQEYLDKENEHGIV
jgi:hypothetical protein